MTTYKNQHYIPQFYLRYFSQDGVRLYRYSLTKKKSERSNINKTCAAFDFYAKGSAAAWFENLMSGLEAAHANVIQKIVDAHNRKHFTIQDLFYLFNFTLLMTTRTRAAKKEVEALHDAVLDAMKPLLDQTKEAKEKGITLDRLNKVKVTRNTANLEGMLVAMIGPPLISDLERTLLINKSNRPFITSDSPVVRYNFLEGGDLGFQSPGLIIFLPLSEEITLCLFDPKMYKPKAITKGNIILLEDQDDVNELNRLQILNADEFLIFSKQDYDEYVSFRHDDNLEVRRAKGISVEKSPMFIVKNGKLESYSFGIMSSITKINYRPRFSFLEITLKPYSHPYRNKVILDFCDAKIKESLRRSGVSSNKVMKNS